MPELPEVETMVRGIRPHVAGRILEDVRAARCRCRPIAVHPKLQAIRTRIRGRRIDQVWRRAKRVVLELDNGEAFVIEPRMTGLMLVADPPDTGHLRIEWRFAPQFGAADRLWFWDRRGLGTVSLLSTAELAQLRGTDWLGPDALEMTPALWTARLQRTSRPIKVALLDQSLVAGIGNLYASEILHLAGISPLRPANALSTKEFERVQTATMTVLTTAIRYEGSTLSDGTYRNALNQSGSYQNAHRVYDRAGELCPTCHKQPVVRIVQAQRSTFYCRRCQPG